MARPSRLARSQPLAALAARSPPARRSGDGSRDAAATAPRRRRGRARHARVVLPAEEADQAFEQETGYDLVVRASGDAGTLTNKLVLTQGNPTGDVAFGVDNTFASRALDDDVFAPYAADAAGRRRELRAARRRRQTALTPVDNGNVCVNVDTTWFAGRASRRRRPSTTSPTRRTRTCSCTPGAASSSTGLAFLLATIAEYGDEVAGLLDRR